MKTLVQSSWGRVIATFCSVALCPISVYAQSFTLSGTNAPDSVQNFPITLAPGTTNLGISVAGNATAFSHLLLKAGATPSELSHDFKAAEDGRSNAINLESPEFKLTNYVLQVRTPANSLTHGFTVTVATNVADMRSASRPATKPLASISQGSIGAATWHYYRVEIPTNMPGWRVLLS